MYKILDLQIPGREFADGALFKSKKEIVEQLADYHSFDFGGTDDKGNELNMCEYLNYYFKTTKEKLDFLLEYGEWSIEKIKTKKEKKCKKSISKEK